MAMRTHLLFIVCFFLLLFPTDIFCKKQNVYTETEYDIIMNRIKDTEHNSVVNIATLNSDVTTFLSSIQADGSWADINYTDRSQSNWLPISHLDRLKKMVLAYTIEENSYYEKNEAIQIAIEKGLQCWYDKNPTSTNWWFQQIASPQRIGIILILMRYGKTPVSSSLESLLLSRMKSLGGDPESQDGANKLDVAIHWVYRGCLTKDATVLRKGVNQCYYPLFLTTDQGLQHDNSYFQHGQQLYVGGYGNVIIGGVSSIALYTKGTQFAIPQDKLALLSKYTRETYFQVIRGRNFHFNVTGRGISRQGALNQSGFENTVNVMRILDADYSTEYDSIISRITMENHPGHGLKTNHRHFWRADYSLCVSPGYSFDVRMVSNRTARNENGNGENIKGYFLSDGATNIGITGEEYYNIFPIWQWNKIPGVTAPLLTTIPKPAEWEVRGSSGYAGGVSDTICGISAYFYKDNAYSSLGGITAKKAWFFFGDEVLCLGNSINSSATVNINTTLNQCWLKGNVAVFSEGSTITPPKGEHSSLSQVNWVWHDNIAYLFPNGGNVQMSNKEQTGSWNLINTSETATAIKGDVFTLWLNHGTNPQDAQYAYVVAPGKSLTDMETYNTNHIKIHVNSDTVQVVENTNKNLFGFVFYESAQYKGENFTIKVDNPCILMLKNPNQKEIETHVADPTQLNDSVTICFSSNMLTGKRGLICRFPKLPYAGSALKSTINQDTPDYIEPPVNTNIVIYPEADAYVKDGSAADINYGTINELQIKKDTPGYARESYLKFSLKNTDLSFDKIKKATLNFQINSSGTATTQGIWEMRQVVDNSWSESTITWNNKPATNNVVLSSKNGMISGNVSFDITKFIQEVLEKKNEIISLHLSSPIKPSSECWVIFHSKESPSVKYRPRIIIEEKTASSITPKFYNQPEVKIYPVPVKQGETLFIDLETSVTGKIKINIIDISGKVLKTMSYSVSSDDNIISQSTLGLNQGIYFISVYDEKDTLLVTEKVSIIK